MRGRPERQMYVVATAGHVDHGKSTLVRALTGTDPDRLEEERRRGLSIELGYAWTELPDVGEVAFVDVPGHQRFIATTLAGVGPVPVAMLVVAADDPWMPQAAEHLAALDALGVSHGLLVVTRSDLTDPAAALARARAEVDRTSLAGAPAVTVSGRSGAGLDELRALLARLLSEVPQPAPDADVRLWVDRRFHVRGAGTVVTGTLPAGTVAVGDTLAAGEHTVRVRGIESLGRPRERMSGVARVALDLGGHAPDEIARGTALVTPGAFGPTRVVDVRLTGEGRVPGQPVLHLGSALVAVHVRPLGKDFYRLALEHPLPLRIGDRAIVRDPGSRTLWGAEVLDPAPPVLGRRGAAARRAEALAAHDGSLAAELRTRGVVRRPALRRIGAPLAPLPDGAVSAGEWLVDAGRAAALRDRLVRLVESAGHAGVPLAAAAHELDLPDTDLVAALAADTDLVADAGRLTPAGAALPPALATALERLRAHLADSPFAAPTADELADLGLDTSGIGALHRDGLVVRLAPGVVVLPDAVDRAVDLLAALPQPFTTSQARQALGTSRRVVLPLLGHLDSAGRTLRLPDDTRRLR
ncbi:selenocysteine-specific translation elongation factor [Nocardioides sp. KR10-350]|uniref:selenocysteine-specific translation elongation factor n=1 Tax=Nocardioides cheoyonin TaxID=3156615 RepID=UPI0032B59226